MNLEQLRDAIARNKVGLGVAGAGVVALIALRARSKGSSSSEPGGISAPAGYAYPSYSAGYQTGGATGYDSTASDVYNAIQPQLEYMQRLYESWDEKQKANPPTPVPAAPATPTPAAPTPKDYGDERRNTIASYYRMILGREPELAGLNWWDATGKSLTEIRQGILQSDEAKAKK